jgi:hypothetical protein
LKKGRQIEDLIDTISSWGTNLRISLVIFLFLFLLFIYFERKREFWIISFFPHKIKKDEDEEIEAKWACVPVLELRSLC